MHRRNINLPREKCLKGLIQLLNEDRKISFTIPSENEIIFKKGSIWDIQFRIKDVCLKGEIDVLGNGSTTIKIFFNRSNHISFLVSLLFLEFFVILQVFYYSTSAFNYILALILIIATIIASFYHVWHIKKAEKYFSNRIFNALNEKSHLK